MLHACADRDENGTHLKQIVLGGLGGYLCVCVWGGVMCDDVFLWDVCGFFDTTVGPHPNLARMCG